MYTLLSKKVTIEEREYTVHGISNGDTEIHNVSENKEIVQRLVDECNSLELDPVHLQDVVADFVNQVAML